MDSFELNKILGALLVTCLFLLSLNIAAGAIFTAAKPAKPGYAIAVAEPTPAAPVAPQPGCSRADRDAAGKKPTSSGAKLRPRNAPPATPSRRAGRTESARTSAAWSAVQRASIAGFNYSAAMKAKGGEWTFEDLDKFLADAERLRRRAPR